jgi:predicted transcriptional regulator
VLDAEGTGADIWGLGKKGAVLAILDKDGIVRFLTREPLSPEQMDSSLELVRSQIDS